MKKDLRITEFLDVYGSLLTKKQREIAESYYDYDLSLSEIAENIGVSRQAVMDSLHTAVKELNEFENRLFLCKILHALETVNSDMSKEEIIAVIGEVLKIYRE